MNLGSDLLKDEITRQYLAKDLGGYPFTGKTDKRTCWQAQQYVVLAETKQFIYHFRGIVDLNGQRTLQRNSQDTDLYIS